MVLFLDLRVKNKCWEKACHQAPPGYMPRVNTVCVHMCLCEDSGKESIHVVFSGRSATVKARSLWLWSTCSRLCAEIRWT